MNSTVSDKSKKVRKSSELRRVFRQFSKHKAAMAGLIIFLREILLAILAPWLTPYNYAAMDMSSQFALPSLTHPFGCDDVGRDILARILYGARYSLSLGIIAALASNLIGMVIGAVAGFMGGWVDNIIMRICDVIQAIPGMLLVIILAALFEPGFSNTIFALTFSLITYPARLIRGQLLKERGNEYVEAEQSINASKARIIFSHLIPNCMSPLIVNTTMGIASRITFAASLSFIGLGVQPPTPEWGAMLSGAREFMRRAPHLVIFPGLAIALTVLSLDLMGDGLRDALDPKLKN